MPTFVADVHSLEYSSQARGPMAFVRAHGVPYGEEISYFVSLDDPELPVIGTRIKVTIEQEA